MTQLFWVLGVFLAKTLQDARLVDLPLSPAFLKLLCGGEVSGMVRDSSDIVTRYSPELLEDVMTSSLLSTVSESEEGSGEVGDRPWWLGQLDLADLASVDPGRGGVLQKLQEVIVKMVEYNKCQVFTWQCQVAAEKAAILSEETLEEDAKAERVNNLTLDGAAIEDLGMTMEYSPSSRWDWFAVVTNRTCKPVKLK